MFVGGSGRIAAKLCGLKALPLNTRATQQSRRGQSIEKTGGFALAPQTMCSPRRGCRTGVRQKSAFVPGPTRQSYTRAWRFSDQISKRAVPRRTTAAGSGGRALAGFTPDAASISQAQAKAAKTTALATTL